MDDDQVRERVTDLLREMEFEDGMVATRWVLAYETAGITDNGESGGNWGYIAQAPVPTIVGLCTLTATHAPSHSDDED